MDTRRPKKTRKYLCIEVKVEHRNYTNPNNPNDYTRFHHISHLMPRKPTIKIAPFINVPGGGAYGLPIDSLKDITNPSWLYIAGYDPDRAAGDNRSWQGFYSGKNPGKCDTASNTWTTINKQRTQNRHYYAQSFNHSTQEDGYYCFRATNTFGVTSYEKIPNIDSAIPPPDIALFHSQDASGDYHIQIVDKQPRDTTTRTSFKWKKIGTNSTCNKNVDWSQATSSTPIKGLTGDAAKAYPTASAKKWISSLVDASSSSIGREAICVRVKVSTKNVPTTTEEGHRKYRLQPQPTVAFFRDVAGKRPVEYFDELPIDTDNFRYGVDNLVGPTGLKEATLKSGHNGYLDSRLDSDSQYSLPTRWASTWEYVSTHQTYETDCSTYSSGWKKLGKSDRNPVTGVNHFTSTYNKSHWLCFRVTSILGDVSYGAFGPGARPTSGIKMVVSPDNNNDGDEARLQFFFTKGVYSGQYYRYVIKEAWGGCSAKVGDTLTGWKESVVSWRVEKAKPEDDVTGDTSRRIVDLAGELRTEGKLTKAKTEFYYGDIALKDVADWRNQRGKGFRYCIAVNQGTPKLKNGRSVTKDGKPAMEYSDTKVDWVTSSGWFSTVPTNNAGFDFYRFIPVGSNLQVQHFYDGGVGFRCFKNTLNFTEISLQSGANGRIGKTSKSDSECFGSSEVSAFGNTWAWNKLIKQQKFQGDTSHHTAAASDCKTPPSSSRLLTNSWRTDSSNFSTDFDASSTNFSRGSPVKRQINGVLDPLTGGFPTDPSQQTNEAVYICVQVRNTLGKMTYDIYPKRQCPPNDPMCTSANSCSVSPSTSFVVGTPRSVDSALKNTDFSHGLVHRPWSTAAQAKHQAENNTGGANYKFTPNANQEDGQYPADGKTWKATDIAVSPSSTKYKRDNHADLINSNYSLKLEGISLDYPDDLGRWSLDSSSVRYDVDYTATATVGTNQYQKTGTSTAGDLISTTTNIRNSTAGVVPFEWDVTMKVYGRFTAPYVERGIKKTHTGWTSQTHTKVQNGWGWRSSKNSSITTTTSTSSPPARPPSGGGGWVRDTAGDTFTWNLSDTGSGSEPGSSIPSKTTSGNTRTTYTYSQALDIYAFYDTNRTDKTGEVLIGTINFGACTRALLADAPGCAIAPLIVLGQTITIGSSSYTVFETGQSNSFTEVTLTNANPFLIKPATGSRYSINHDTNSYASYPATGGLSNHDSIAPAASLTYTEAPTIGVVWPGPHTQTWTIKWQSDAKNKYTPPGSTDIWAGPEAKATIANCGTNNQEKVYASTTEPRCIVNHHIFDEGYPNAYVSIRLTNRSAVPLSLELAQFKIENSPGSGTYPAYANVNLPGTIPTGYSTAQTGWGWSRVVSKKMTATSAYQEIGVDSGAASSQNLVPASLSLANAQIRTSYSANTLQDTYDKHNNQTGWGWTSQVDYYNSSTSNWMTIGHGHGTAASPPNFTTPTTETVNQLKTVVTLASGNNTHRQPVPSGGSLIVRSPKNQSRPQGDYGVHWKLTLKRGLESWTSDTANPSNNSHTSDAWARPHGMETVTCPIGNLQFRIRRVPFVKTFFGDISAGGTFGAGRAQDACLTGVNGSTNPSGRIYGYSVASRQTTGPDIWRGASTQYALQAKHDVVGFYSSANNNPGFELSLANANTSLTAHNFGGNLGVDRCLFNYWRPVADLVATQVDAIDLAILVDEDQELYQPKTTGSAIRLSQSSNPDPDLKATVYIDGDVIIGDDIINNDVGTNWSGINQIGLIQIIARGNIYIDKDVTTIDASLVAYPENTTDGGHIYTCSDGTDTYAGTTNSSLASGHFSDCNRQLVVRGSLVGRQVHFGRIFDSVLNEPPKSGYDLTKTNATRASEVIFLSPELSLAQPATTLFDDFNYSADAILVLPPNF